MAGPRIPALRWKSTQGFSFRSGESIPELTIAYEAWGDSGNAPVLVLHALSGSSHARSSAEDPLPGWWEQLFVDDAPLTPREHFIVCTNLLGGCNGSTGPSSIDPARGRPFGTEFPAITIADMIEAHREFLRANGIASPVTLIGGSMGGMMGLEWAARYPDEVRECIALVSPGRSFPQAIALRAVQREAIQLDPNWRGGDYYGGPPPADGLALARKLGMITYRSSPEFDERFGRAVRNDDPHFLRGLFEVQSYLNHQGRKLVDRFDANTYLYFSRAMDLFDLSTEFGSLDAAAARVTARVLLLAVETDFLCPVEHMREVDDALQRAGKSSRLTILKSIHGHDAFLIETEQINTAIARFVEER